MAESSAVLRLADIIEAIERVRDVLGDMALEDFEFDWQKQWLVERGVEIISEASRRSKRGLYTKGERRMVTGLIVTPVGEVSIGRERKRTISVMLHKFSIGDLDAEQLEVLKGLLGFTIANEPTFVNRMREKYGNSVVDTALRTHSSGRPEHS
jgi:hypothetical protein